MPSVPTFGIRGFDRTYYGTANNSTIPDPREVAAIVGVKPCMMAHKNVWRFAWRAHGKVLPILHFRDNAKPRDSSYSLKVLWCKAIASMDRRSLAFDDRWTYDTLPSASRWMLRLIPTGLFPRLHHANIELRTAYLDKTIQSEIDRLPGNTAIKLVSLGAGYDVRCSRFMSQYHGESKTVEAYELDLIDVVQSKKLILDKVKRRRPGSLHPCLIDIDLNDEQQVNQTLEYIVLAGDNNQGTHTIFISEGVMIYLDEGVPRKLLRQFRDAILNETSVDDTSNTASFCFADRLENVPGGDIEAASNEFSRAGWDLIDWCPKPGLARHMGLCRSRQIKE